MSADADRLARLPVWARGEIERLRRDKADLLAARAVGPAESNTFIWHGTGADTPLGDEPIIEFHVPDQDDGRYGQARFSVRLTDDVLHVRCSTHGRSGALHVIPDSTNVVRIKIGDFA